MKKTEKTVLYLLPLMVLCVFQGFAQTVITGTVKGSQGEILLGVSVKVKDGSAGISSDNDGKYSVAIPSLLLRINGKMGI